MPRIELYAFRYRDPVTGRWLRARYRAERHEIEQRYAEYEIVGPAETRDVDTDAPRFTPHVERAALQRRRCPDVPSDHRQRREAPLELQPHLSHPPAIDVAEIGLLELFLRRYVTYCARRSKYAAMNGAVRLFVEVQRTSPDQRG